MALKRENITSKQFGKSFNGFDRIEVQAFLEWIADEYDALRIKNIELEKKIKEYEFDFKNYEKEKEEFKQEQIQAKKDIDKLKRETAKECEISQNEAKLNAQNVLKDAFTQTKELKNDIDKLNKIKQSFIRRYQTLLRDQLDTLKVFQREFVPDDDSVKITSKATSKRTDIFMYDIKSIQWKSDELLNSIDFTPDKAEIISGSWKNIANNFILIKFNIEGLIENEFFVDRSENKIIILWSCEDIIYDLKDFFKIMIRILKFAGIKQLLVLDECISVKNFPQEFVSIKDHINFTSDNPLIGYNDDNIGTRFPDMSQAYSENYFNRFSDLKKVVLAGVDEPVISDKMLEFIRISDAEVCNFSVMWMNILANHAGMDFLLFVKLISDKYKENNNTLRRQTQLVVFRL